VTLLAFAAERRAAVCRATEAPLLLSAELMTVLLLCAVLLKHHCC